MDFAKQFTLRQLLVSVTLLCTLVALVANTVIGVPILFGTSGALIFRYVASTAGKHWLWLWSSSFVGSTLSTSLLMAVVIQRVRPPVVDPGIILVQMVIIGVVIATGVELFLLAIRSLG